MTARDPFTIPYRAPDLETPSAPATESLGPLWSAGREFASRLALMPGRKSREWMRREYAVAERRLKRLARNAGRKTDWNSDDLRRANAHLLDVRGSRKEFADLPMARLGEQTLPRVLAVAVGAICAEHGNVSEEGLCSYLRGILSVDSLTIGETNCLPAAIAFSLLAVAFYKSAPLDEEVEWAFAPIRTASIFSPELEPLLRSQRVIEEFAWPELVEPLMEVDRILRADPSGTYAKSDQKTREDYRRAVADIAAHGELDEREVAQMAVELARSSDEIRLRSRNVGYYLLDEGVPELRRNAGYAATNLTAFQNFLRRFPDEVFMLGFEGLTLFFIACALMFLVARHPGWALLVAVLYLLIPASQTAMEVFSYLVTMVLPPRQLPKLDFEYGVPVEHTTMIAIPCLLLDEAHVRRLVEDLESRYLANRDPHVHFALLTDLPDSDEATARNDKRVELAVALIDDLNNRYRHSGSRFLLLHRNHQFNSREGSFMGWERKRGKLLDLNQFLRGVEGAFPVKAGPFEDLPRVAYVIAIDSDTQLPPGSAKRLIGAMAHPLNRPVIDWEQRVVVRGFGILQPRVSVSVESSNHSRLAKFLAGHAGLDIYTQAVSDVYQDLYGSGIFTGKGIYDVDCLRSIIEKRFPRNQLLSHDLLEGEYARTALLSDVEVIEAYPSRYSTYCRRKHRWQRGDWQIAGWVGATVSDESRNRIDNPISLTSRLRLVDNLRRSLVDPGYLVLFLAGWFALAGGPAFWTLIALLLLFIPLIVRFLGSLVRVAVLGDWTSWRDPFRGLAEGARAAAINFVFLPHQAMVSLDAVFRTLSRTLLTHRRLLQWETAHEAEAAQRLTSIPDQYLKVIPLFSIVLVAFGFFRMSALPWIVLCAGVWAISPMIAAWLSKPLDVEADPLVKGDIHFLRSAALPAWRYFEIFSTVQNRSLIPDHILEKDLRTEERSSPTNIGLLLNARQAAFELGYLTHGELLIQTRATLATVNDCRRFRGHLFNWIDNETGVPLEPGFVSTVDSGNLAASLWSLEQGLLELRTRPFLERRLADGLRDYEHELHGKEPSALTRGVDFNAPNWFSELLVRIEQAHQSPLGTSWRSDLLGQRKQAVLTFARAYVPWALPEFSNVFRILPANLRAELLDVTPIAASQLYARVLEILPQIPCYAEERESFTQLLTDAGDEADRLSTSLTETASLAAQLVDQMDFEFLYNGRRKEMSVGYDMATQRNYEACYDRLASEARTALFIAIAKGDVPYEAWFRLGRRHASVRGETALVSWTGTMFEYLMPLLWMKAEPGTLLSNACKSCVKIQEDFGVRNGIPWGVSECAHESGELISGYEYFAFGLRELALSPEVKQEPIISPYSTCLALSVDKQAAIRNLRRIAARGWRGKFGFYESIDFRAGSHKGFAAKRGVAMRMWMAHHQGMELLALCNSLCQNPFQRWFHANRYARSVMLLLNEKPVSAGCNSES